MSRKKTPVGAAVDARNQQPHTHVTVKDCMFTGVHWDKAQVDLLAKIVDAQQDAIDAVHNAVNGLNDLTRLLHAGNINIQSLLRVGGEEPKKP